MEYKDTPEIIDELLSYITMLMPKATQLSKEEVQKQIRNRNYSWIFLQTYAMAKLLKQYQDKIEWLEKQLDYETADDATLEKIGNNKNIPRLQATPSNVVVYFCVSELPEVGEDILIPQLTEVSTSTATPIKFRTKESAKITSESEWIAELSAYGVGVVCESIEAGSHTLVEAEAIDTLISTIPEIEFVLNTEISTDGRDLEAREAYIERLRTSNLSLQKGQAQWWTEELAKFSFVKTGVPVEARYGNGTTVVYLAGYPTVTEAEKQTLSDYFNSDDMRTGGGWNILFDEILNVNVSLDIKIYGSLTADDFSEIQTATQAYFDVLGIGEDFYINDYIAYLRTISGVVDAEVIAPDVRLIVIEEFQIANLSSLVVSEWIMETQS